MKISRNGLKAVWTVCGLIGLGALTDVQAAQEVSAQVDPAANETPQAAHSEKESSATTAAPDETPKVIETPKIASAETAAEPTPEEPINTALQSLIEGGEKHYLGVTDYLSLPFKQVVNLYFKTQFQPLWYTEARKTGAAETVLESLHHVEEEGLDPDDYTKALDKISELVKTPETDPNYRGNLLRADILLTHTLMQFISDARGERLTPKKIDKELYLDKPSVVEEDILFAHIEKAIPKDKEAPWLALLPPQHSEYKALKSELKKLREKKASGIILEEKAATAQEKQEIEDAKKIQKDSKRKQGKIFVGQTIDDKISQIIVTMERWRWMPEKLADKSILVNIPEFKAFAANNGKIQFTMPVIVGKNYRETPVLYSQITNIIFNPYWNVPHDLAVLDKLPLIHKEGAGYLTKKKIRVYQNGVEISPESIDWSSVSKGSFDYQLRQSPGDMNALGRLRFTINNPFNVYLHGTPEQNLFSKSKRNLSSGCIRLEDPIKMAEFVFGDANQWSPQTIKADIDQGNTKTVPLKTPVDVYLQYFTVRPDDKGEMQHFEDVYGQDKQILKALKSRRSRAP